MKVIPLVVGACLFTTGALAQSVQEMQKMADEGAAAFNKAISPPSPMPTKMMPLYSRPVGTW